MYSVVVFSRRVCRTGKCAGLGPGRLHGSRPHGGAGEYGHSRAISRFLEAEVLGGGQDIG